MFNIKVVILFVFLFFIKADFVLSQGCCTAATSSLGGTERSVLPSGNLTILTGYDYNYLGSSYNGRNKIPDPLNRTANVSYYSLQLEYGITNKLSVLAITNYTSRERKETVTSPIDNTRDMVSFKGQGIGDIIILGKYEIISAGFFNPLIVAIGGGAKLPVGSFQKDENGSRLAINLQPGTGASDLLLWNYLSYSINSLGLTFYSNILYRYPGVNLDGYRIGDELLFNLGVNYNYTEYLTFSLQVKSRFSKPDFALNRELPSTGQTNFDLFPYINYYERNVLIRVYTMIPLYRNVRGIQLTVSQVFGVQLQYSFNFNEL